MQRRVIFYRNENGRYIAECPSLPGCVSQGRTKSEAAANIIDAMKAHIRALQAYGMPIPEDRSARTTRRG